MLDEEDDGETRSTGSSPMVLDSAMSGTAFRACVEQVLMPTLRPGDTIVMGNLPTHKAEGVRQAIEVSVASYSTTPPNSPDFKPSKRPSPSLALLRARAKRTVEALWDAIGEIVALFKLQECANYFTACGHDPKQNRRALGSKKPEEHRSPGFDLEALAKIRRLRFPSCVPCGLPRPSGCRWHAAERQSDHCSG